MNANVDGISAIVFSLDNGHQLDMDIADQSGSSGSISMDITTPAQIDSDIYDGPVVVDPTFKMTTLETKHKLLTDDVTVNPIQVESVSNPQGGRTVYIGGVFNG